MTIYIKVVFAFKTRLLPVHWVSLPHKEVDERGPLGEDGSFDGPLGQVPPPQWTVQDQLLHPLQVSRLL